MPPMRKTLKVLVWSLVAAAGAGALCVVALHRGETINAGWLVVAAICTYAVAYRFYARHIARKVMALDNTRATPAERLENGRDFVPTNKWVLYGHHFAAIAGAGPLVGPVLAAQFGYLPGTLWLIIGVVLAGAVQDFVILFASVRRDGKSLGQIAKEEVNRVTGTAAMIAILAIMVILLAVLALVVVRALAESPWGTFTIACTIPIALAMGWWMNVFRKGKTVEATIGGVALLLLALYGGKLVAEQPVLANLFTFKATTLAYLVIGYGFIASVLPVWLLLAPRDYLSTFMKLGTIGALAVAIMIVLPPLRLPAVTQFVEDRSADRSSRARCSRSRSSPSPAGRSAGSTRSWRPARPPR
jgi:carbon starvation protein